jgi:gamma-glutamyltranspeptidase
MRPLSALTLSLACKRVRQTINPALTQDGKPYMVFETPGADMQPRGFTPRVTVT